MADYTSVNAPLVLSPTGLEVPIQSIQLDLAALTFLEVSYGRARLQPIEQNSNKVEPMVYVKNRNYKTVLPNDNLNSLSFIIVTSPETIEELNHNSKSQTKEVDLAIIVWFNMEKLNKFEDLEFFEDYKNQVEEKLAFNSNVLSINSIIDEDAKEIFSPFSIDECEKELLMYPYGGFRFDITIGYESFCQQ